MDKQVFTDNITKLTTFENQPITDVYMHLLWINLQDKYTNEQFEYITNKLIDRGLYNRQPKPSDWFQFKKEIEPTNDDLKATEKRKFLSEVAYYIKRNSLYDCEKNDFQEMLTPSMARALSAVGGISSIYSRCRSDGAYSERIAGFEIRKLDVLFDDMFKAGAVEVAKNAIENNSEMKNMVADLVQSSIKRIE